LLFCQGVSGYKPLRRDRRQRLDELRTGDGRLLPKHLKAQIGRELARLEQLLEQIKAVEAERDALFAAAPAPGPPAMLLNIKGIGPEFAAILWSEGPFRHFETTDSLYTPFLSICKHWKLIFRIFATRATFARDRVGDALVA
jgi:transposase